MTMILSDSAHSPAEAHIPEDSHFLEEALALLGSRGLIRDLDLIAPWLTDWRGRYTGRALALAAPADTAELAALIRLCDRHQVAVVPQGGNSGMVGGATPNARGDELLLSLRRLNQIERMDVGARQVTCGAGVVLQTLHEAADEVGLRFPLTLGGKGSATIGGLVSTNAGGTQVLRHGAMRALVLGVEAVLADGSIYSALTPLKKDNRGFDLKQLLIGSEGTLGIITAATLRLVPAIADRIVVWAGVDSIQTARRLLLHAEAVLGDALEGFEVIPQSSLEAVLELLPDARSPLTEAHAWYALIEVVADHASVASLPGRVETMLADAFEAGLLSDATIAANETQAEAFWTLRDSVAPAERAQGPAMQHDISVPVERMADFVDMAVPTMEARWPGTRAIAFGHLGDGNVHFHVISPPGSDRAIWEAGDGAAISHDVYDLVAAWHGSISAEHGIGQAKHNELVRLGDPVAIDMMRRVKAALDPAGLLNPGKLITVADDTGNALARGTGNA
jgi:FAD/FMN-containing dehydrogenase